MKGACEAGQIWDKPPKYITQAKKRTKLGLCSEVFELFHRVGGMLCEFQVAWSNNMTQVANDLSEERAFL